MPSKQYLMDNYASASLILEYAVANHNTAPSLVNVNKVAGQVKITCKDATSEEMYEGSGKTKHEALADCISAKFPS